MVSSRFVERGTNIRSVSLNLLSPKPGAAQCAPFYFFPTHFKLLCFVLSLWYLLASP